MIEHVLWPLIAGIGSILPAIWMMHRHREPVSLISASIPLPPFDHLLLAVERDVDDATACMLYEYASLQLASLSLRAMPDISIMQAEKIVLV